MQSAEPILLGEESSNYSAFRCTYKYDGGHRFCVSYGYSFNEVYQEYEAKDFFREAYSETAVEELRRAHADWILPLCQKIADGVPVSPEEIRDAAQSSPRSARERRMQEAVAVAGRVVAGELEPSLGCSMIGEINHELDWPADLSALGMLAHEQTGHEHVGITSESCVPEIITECEKLVAYAANHSVRDFPSTPPD